MKLRFRFTGPVLLLAASGCFDPEAPADPAQTQPQIIEVVAGASARSLTETLVDAGVVASPWGWRWYLRSRDGRCVKAGRHALSPAMGMREVLDVLCAAPIPDDVPLTVPEGLRARDIDAALVQAGLIEPGAYLAVVEHKAVQAPFEVPGATFEGYLYPETYRVEPDRFDVAAFVRRQLETFREQVIARHPDLSPERLHDVVVMASMIEREEPDPANRPLVAGILWKRIAHDWALGVDATSRYSLVDPTDRALFLRNLRDPADLYNTRLRKGLPPTAIGNPGLVSIEAALAPIESPYWYYLHDATGTIHPAKSGEEHAANRKKYDVH